MRVRCEVLKNKGAKIVHFNQALQDSAPRVICLAIQQAVTHNVSLSEDEITKLLLLSQDMRKSRAYLSYVNTLPRYEKLTFLLSIYRRSGYDLHQMIQHKIWVILCGGLKPTHYYKTHGSLLKRLQSLPKQVDKYQKAFDVWKHAKEAFKDQVLVGIIDAEFALLGFKPAQIGENKNETA